MSNSEYDYCNYCGRYRPLKYSGGYCSRKCYEESGQAEQDAIHSAEVDALWYERDDMKAIIIRTLYMSAGWFILYMFGLFISVGRHLVKLGKILGSPPWAVILGGIIGFSILQNIIMKNKGKRFRCIILYGIPIGLCLFCWKFLQ